MKLEIWLHLRTRTLGSWGTHRREICFSHPLYLLKCVLYVYFFYSKSLNRSYHELKTVWNICVFSSPICVCHLLPCLVPLTLMTWEAGTDSRLTLEQSPISKECWYLSSWFVWLMFLFPPTALAECKHLIAKNPGYCWEGFLGRRISRGNQCQERLELHVL